MWEGVGVRAGEEEEEEGVRNNARVHKGRKQGERIKTERE